MPIIPQSLNINNLRTTIAKSTNLYTIRKLIEYSLTKVLVKAMFSLTVFELLVSKVGRYYHPPSREQGAKELNKNLSIFDNIMLMGDFNIDFNNKKDSNFEMFKNFCDTFSLTNLVEGHICFTKTNKFQLIYF